MHSISRLVDCANWNSMNGSATVGYQRVENTRHEHVGTGQLPVDCSLPYVSCPGCIRLSASWGAESKVAAASDLNFAFKNLLVAEYEQKTENILN